MQSKSTHVSFTSFCNLSWSEKEGLNMLEMTQDNMKQEEITFHPSETGSTWTPCFSVTPGCPQHCSKPSVVLELLEVGLSRILMNSKQL